MKAKAAMDAACQDSSDEPKSDNDYDPGPSMQQNSDQLSSDIDDDFVDGSDDANDEPVLQHQEVRCPVAVE